MPKKFKNDYWLKVAAARKEAPQPGFSKIPSRENLIGSNQKNVGRWGPENIKAWLLYSLVMVWVVRNTIFIRRRPGDLYAALDTMAMFQVGIVFAILLILLSGPGLKLLAQIKHSSLKFYFLYYLLALLSAAWSINPAFSFYRALEVLALSLAVLVFCASGIDTEKNIKRTRIVVWSVVLMIAAASARSGSFWNLRNNTLGAAAVMAACFFIAWILAGREQKKDRKRLIQGSIGLSIVLLSFSLASWWSFWFGILYCAVFSRRKSLIFGLFAVGVLIFFILGTDTRENLLVRDKAPDEIQTLTGRKILWADFWSASMERPVAGFGFAIGAREVSTIYTTNTHNLFFGALLSLGWVGVILWSMFYFALFQELIKYRHSRNPPWLACAAALAAGTLNSMSLSILSEQWSAATTVFIAFLGLHMRFLQEAKQIKQEQPDLSYGLRFSRVSSWGRRPWSPNDPIR